MEQTKQIYFLMKTALILDTHNAENLLITSLFNAIRVVLNGDENVLAYTNLTIDWGWKY